jgi:hypothetical protein
MRLIPGCADQTHKMRLKEDTKTFEFLGMEQRRIDRRQQFRHLVAEAWSACENFAEWRCTASKRRGCGVEYGESGVPYVWR